MNDEKISSNAIVEALNILAKQIASLSQTVGDIRQLVGPIGIPMPNDQMLIQTIYGIKYLIDPHDLIMAPQLIVYRQWEADLSQFFVSSMTKDSVFVDVGANFGYFTCLAAAKIGVGGTGKVFAIEPNPKLIALLRANSSINWSMCPVGIHHLAAGPKSASVRLQIPTNRAANASLTKATPSSDVDILDVSQKMLDEIVPEGTVVHFMKIDVEGHEFGVLEGARRTISNSPSIRIIMEWSVPQMLEAGFTPRQLTDLVDDLGLKVFEVPKGANVPLEPIDTNVLHTTPYANILLSAEH